MNDQKEKKNFEIFFVCWQSLYKGNPTGMLRVLLPLFKEHFNSCGKKATLYIGYSIGTISEKKVHSINITNKIFVLITNKIYTNIKKSKIPYGYVRLLQEKLFDYLVAKKIKKVVPIKLVTTAYIPKAFQINHNSGGVNIFLPGNPCDVKVFELLSTEHQKYSFPITDAYLYKERVNFIKKCVELSDIICAPNEVVAETYRETYKSIKVKDLDYSLLISEKWALKPRTEEPSSLNFFYCAHTTWLKGLFYLLEAWEKITETSINGLGTLHIVGEFSHGLKDYIKQKYRLTSNIIYWGGRADAEVIARECHVSLVPSLLDGNPQTIFESMAAGLPVIATSTCGNSRYINHRINGSVVLPADADALVEEMIWYCNNRHIWKQLSFSAQKTYKTYGRTVDFKEVAQEILLC
jgi:glycosyltransferase involved in cell wall biosynthesis